MNNSGGGSIVSTDSKCIFQTCPDVTMERRVNQKHAVDLRWSQVSWRTPEITIFNSLHWPPTAPVWVLLIKNWIIKLSKDPSISCLKFENILRASWLRRSKAVRKSCHSSYVSGTKSKAFCKSAEILRRASRVPRSLRKPNCRFAKSPAHSAYHRAALPAIGQKLWTK